jgi:hypothetical protein
VAGGFSQKEGEDYDETFSPAKILRRFRIEDCKPMATPMITNLKKVTTSYSRLVDPTLYRQLIGSLMYLVNTIPNICFAMNTLS